MILDRLLVLLQEKYRCHRQILIPVFCLWHVLAIAWWTLPYSFSNWLTEQGEYSTETLLIQSVSLADSPFLLRLLSGYIDMTGSQQYWDFFAPHSARNHQYLSLCSKIISNEAIGGLSCAHPPLFSNLADHIDANGQGRFEVFGSDRSRIYRLTENLAKRQDDDLLKAFAGYYFNRKEKQAETSIPISLVLHQFELHHELPDMPKTGYRADKVLIQWP